MNQTNNIIREEWKKEFRKQFIWDDENELGMPTNPFPSSDRVISFIDELLKSQRDSIVERIEKAMPSHDAVQKELSLIKEQ